jgi:LPXTG-motif cell wall-anchored protein
MFDGDTHLTSTGNLDNWNTSNVTDMSFMFNGDQALQNIGNISNWDVKNVESMINMFSGTSSLKQTQDLSKWNQIKADEYRMFDNTGMVVKGSFDFTDNGLRSYIDSKKNAEKLNVSNYKTDRVTDMSKLFQGFTKLKQITGLGTWNVSHVTTMNSMFRDCPALTSIDLYWGNNTRSVKDFSGMFANDSSLETINGINGWDVENATDLSFMFQSVNGTPWPGDPNGFYNYSATGALKQLDLSNWKTDKVQNMEGLFWGQQDLKSVGNFDNWKTDNVQKMDNMFAFCNKLKFSPAAIHNMSSWHTGKVTTMRELFEGLQSQTDLSCVQNWDTHSVRDMSYMFSGDRALTNVGNLEHRGYIWDTSKVGTDQPTGAPEKQNYGMSLMFANCESLPEIQGINTWDVSNVTKMRGMFQNTNSLKDIDLSNWNTQSLKIAGRIFYESGAQSINLSGWDFRHLAHFSDSGMTTNPAKYLVHRGSEFMFADLANPCVITMNNIKLPANRKEGFDVIDFAGHDNVPLVVFSPELLTVHGANSDAALNEETWGWGSVADQTGRQNSNYLTYYKRGDARKTPIAYQKMNFIFASPKQLRTLLILASLPTGQADASSSDILADYAKELSAVDKVKNALGPTLASKWKSEADLQGNYLRDVLNALNDPAETPVALVSAKYGLTFNATARIHYIDATNQTGTLTHDPAHEITSEERDYDPTGSIAGADLPTWDFVGHGWQLKTTDLPETMGAADGDYYVYLVAPEKTKTITETINYVIGNNPVDASIAGNPVSGPKVITFTQQETGFDRLTLRPIYGRWVGSIDAINAPETVKDSDGNIYGIDLANVNGSDPRIFIDSARNVHLNIDPDSVNDGAAFTLTIPYVRRNEPVNPGDHHPTKPTVPDKKSDKPSKPGKDDKPVKPGKSDHLKNNADKGSKDINGQHHSATQNRSVRRHAVAGRVNRTISQSKVSGQITQIRKGTLPQTGNSRRSSQLGLVALGLASLAALLGLAGTRKKNRN